MKGNETKTDAATGMKTKKKMKPEPFYIDARGKRRDDGLHNAMLENNPEADFVFQEGCVQSAIKRGLTESEARKLYGSQK